MTWIDALLSNFWAVINFFRPYRVLRPYERGVVFRLGRYHRTMHEGFNWLIPCRIEEVDDVTVAEETRNLLTQSVTTKDDITVTFSCNIVFQCVDPEAYRINVHDPDASLDALAMTHLAARAREWTWAELRENQAELERSLKGTLTTRVKRWGIEVIAVGFTDFVRAKPLRLYGDPSAARPLGVMG